MKNIYIIPTDKPSRLILQDTELVLSKYMEENEGFSEFNQNIYITSDEKIKEGDYIISLVDDESFEMVWKCDESQIKYMIDFDLEFKKIILTTDQDLIKDGVQSIDDEFLEWFVKNPSCKYVDVMTDTFTVKEMSMLPLGTRNFKYKIIIPKEEPKQTKCYCGHTSYCDCSPLDEAKQETLEEAFEKTWLKSKFSKYSEPKIVGKNLFIEGAKWQQERSYNERYLIKCYCGHTTTCDCEPLEEPKQETLEEAAERLYPPILENNHPFEDWDKNKQYRDEWINGAKWQAERMYSEEDMINFHKWVYQKNRLEESDKTTKELLKEWFEQFKKK
jgi:acetone carboxylase gamma subunit